VGTWPEAERVSAPGSGSGREGGRSLKQRVKTAKKRTVSQTRWLERQLNDPYVAQAKREGYRSRAAYKLIEMDEKFHLLKPGQKVVDLGAAPGGWSQIAARRVGSPEKGKVVAIDLLEMPEIPGVSFAQLDFLKEDAPAKLLAMMDGARPRVRLKPLPPPRGRPLHRRAL